MIVFSAATAGSNRHLMEKEVLKMASRKGKTIRVINFIDEMVDSAKTLNKKINPSTLPNLDIKTLEVLKKMAFHKISDTVKSHSDTDFIIDGHMSFWWRSGPISLLKISDFKELDPDFFVTVVAEPDYMLKSLKSKNEWTDKEVNVYELTIWSELEKYTTDIVSEALGKKHYILGTHEEPSVLYDLMYSPEKLKVYVSFSMAHNEKGYKDLDKFLNKIKKYAIIFNPRTIDLKAYYGMNDDRMQTLVYNQTVRRDYGLIEQSDLVIVYLPTLVYSSGVDSERLYAHNSGKQVLLYFPFEMYSPFTPYFVDKMYKKEEDLIKRVKAIYKQVNSKK